MSFDDSFLRYLTLHKIGNCSTDDGVVLSEKLLEVGEVVKPLLLQYFLSPFRMEELYNLSHPADLELNEVFHFVTAVFENPGCLLEQSQHLARHLYRQSGHPKIRPGEFYVTYFENCFVNNEPVNAVGLFKSESRETYLKVYPVQGSFEIGHDDGININKLDKGCLIFNTGREEGYVVAMVDNQNKGNEAQYWRDDFLRVKPRSDNYYQTKVVMDLCKKFVSERLPQEFEVTRADQADLLNRSMKFLKENESFGMDEFGEQVLGSPGMINSFAGFRDEFSEEHQVPIAENFEISDNAVKKQARFMKSVIKLDRNFHIYIHGEGRLVEKGYDQEKQMNFYKLFFKEES